MRTKISTLGARLVVDVNAVAPNKNVAPGATAETITIADGNSLASAARMARQRKLPLLMRMTCAGTDIHAGIDVLHSWGVAAHAISQCSGVVPTILIAQGFNVSGVALLLGLADFVIMTADSYAFIVGPHTVENFTGVSIDRAELGGAHIHANDSGLASFVVDDVEEAEEVAIELLSYISDSNDTEPPTRICTDPVNRLTPEAFDILPATSSGSYDVRSVIETIVDYGGFLEVHPEWAPNLVTAFASIGGRSVGVIANQPQSMAGTLDITASRKGGRFVAFCDAFNLPLITFIDTSGFYPGKDLEWRGMIRYGAQMAFAYARATVPRVNVTLRKSYGGAYIVMDSKMMGNDIALAWPSAEIAVMGAKGAVGILHRSASPEEKAELETAYENRLLNPYIAAERGAIDIVIDPAETRREVHAALDLLISKRENLPARRHDNTPL